jgi:hypothetical protein
MNSFPSDDPPRLVAQQDRHWAPLHAWVRAEFGEELALASGISAPSQSAALGEKMLDIVNGLDTFELAGAFFLTLERWTDARRSFRKSRLRLQVVRDRPRPRPKTPHRRPSERCCPSRGQKSD